MRLVTTPKENAMILLDRLLNKINGEGKLYEELRKDVLRILNQVAKINEEKHA